MGSRLDKNSAAVSKRIQNHDFDNEEGEEYEPSKFGGFPEYFRRKKIKLQNLDAQVRAEAGDKPVIFRGIVAHVNGYTQPSLNDLHRLIVTHGGGFMQYLDGKTTVTHIIASNLTPKKVVEFKRYRIVKPAWVVDSVECGKLLPWENYRVVDEGVGQKVLQFDQGTLGTQVNRKSTGYRDQTHGSWYTKQLVEDAQTSDVQHPKGNEEFDDIDFPSSAQLSDTQARSTQQVASQPSDHAAEHSVETVIESNHIPLVQHKEPISPIPPSAENLDSGVKAAASDSVIEKIHVDQPETALLEASLQTDALRRRSEDVIHEKSLMPEIADPRSPTPKRKLEAVDSPSAAKKAKMTAEEHNSVLLADPRIRKSSVLNPDFLEQYYRESRLHHLSTWKADLKAQLQAITAEKTSTQKARQKPPPNARRYVLHVDFDSFFVAVSLKNFPQFVDKPAVVAHGAGSGSEIASCNYPARAYGVKNGMWMKRAQEMCDDLKVLPYDFPAYEAASRLFYDAIIDTEGLVQSVSIDEALVDVSLQCHRAGGFDGIALREGNIWREQAKADELAQGLRDRVKEQTGCAVSVGIGGNILLAKLALRKAKPAGQHQIRPEDVIEFIGELEVQSLPGVAYSIGGKLEEIGIKFVKDIRGVTRERLTSVLGPKTGEKIWNYSRGIDCTEVGDQVVRKSVSAEVNWGVRFETQEQADEFVENLCGELSRRLLKEGVRGTNLTMKIMRRAPDAPLDPPKHLGHGKCDTYNKSVALGVATNVREVIAREALAIIRGYGFSPGELRGLGVQMTKLEPIKPKTNANSDIDGSQRRLQFNTGPTRRAPTDGAQRSAEAKGPSGSQKHLYNKSQEKSNKQSVADDSKDDIQDDPETPKKPKSTLLSHLPAHIDSPSRKPLNTSGTQFVLPTQVDPQVLAELPPEIRERLAKHVASRVPAPQQDSNHQANASPERAQPMAFTALPSSSQLDHSILSALPADVRAEILSQYNKSPTSKATANNRGQSILPQSPRKNRTIRGALPKRGRSRGGSLLARLKGASSGHGASTLTQSNFVAVTHAPRHNEGATDSEGDMAAATASDPTEISAEFLAALPQDVRAEVMENHRREQLKRTGGIEVSDTRRRRQRQQQQAGRERAALAAAGGDAGAGGDTQDRIAGERVLRLPAKPARPTFTLQKLWQMEELRDAVGSWVDEFAVEGPYAEDVEALGKYLRAVVVDEGDMRKATGVCGWLKWCVETRNGDGVSNTKIEANGKWAEALEMARQAVGAAVEERGLGEVQF